MIQQTISELEAKIRAATLSDPAKTELLQLVARLKAETGAESGDKAGEKQKLKSSMEELRSSVAGFEQSHPKIVQAVNSISTTLSNLGI